jgi:hypothetical protein
MADDAALNIRYKKIMLTASCNIVVDTYHTSRIDRWEINIALGERLFARRWGGTLTYEG